MPENAALYLKNASEFIGHFIKEIVLQDLKANFMRKKAIIKLSAVSAVLALALVLTFLPIIDYLAVTGTMAKRMDAESGGGLYAVYEAHMPANHKDRSKASFSEQLTARMRQSSYVAAKNLQQVYNVAPNTVAFKREGGNRIRVEVPGFLSVAPVCDLMEREIDLVIVDSSGGDAIPGSYILNAKMHPNQLTNSYDLYVDLDPSGSKLWETSTDSTFSIIDKAARDLYGESETDTTYGTGYKIEDNLKLSGNRLIKEGVQGGLSQIRILASARPLQLVLVETGAVSNNNAEKTLKILMCGIIAAAVLGLAFLLIHYRVLGALGAGSFLSAAVLLAFFMAVLPFSQLSLAAICAMAVSFALMLISHAALFERAKEEYALGKSVQASVASAFKRLFWPLFDIHVLTLVAGAILWILGEGAAAGFGIVLFMGSILSCAASLALTRWLFRLTIQIGGDEIDGGILALKRPEGFKESDKIPDPEPETDMNTEAGNE